MMDADHSPLASASVTASATKEKRVSRACIACRQRKTRCDLYSHGAPGDPPCTRCVQENLDCTLATSRRGGRRPRRHPTPVSTPTPAPPRGHTTAASSSHRAELPDQLPDLDDDGDFAARDLLNPSDALNLLAQVADLDGDHEHDHEHSHEHGHAAGRGADTRSSQPAAQIGYNIGTMDEADIYYPPISDGQLSLADASYLLSQ